MNHRTFGPAELAALLAVNRLREAGSGAAAELEHRFANSFSAHHQLAVYGSLAPGGPSHNELSHLNGEWQGGYSVTGELQQSGWGADIGYPALRWLPTGGEVEVHLFVSPLLPERWAQLDMFEGPDYLRILVPVHRGGLVATVANLYAARPLRME
jgi:gamma-glutamylcyclotransferase (GGCT)/AIG2-like uncharacterized protein YtfP